MALLRAGEQVGRVLGNRYRLLRPIGTGASAHVYVAEDVRLHRRVALKVLHPALAEDKSFLLRFRAEAQTVAALRHRSIMRVYDWGEDGGDPYLVVELLEGGSLRTLLDSGYRLSVSQTAALGLDVASALTYAHARGLVHRDIKPANLLFDEEGRASIADFGLARALAEASWTEPTGTVVGTARYAAPEQLKGVALDGRADVYSMTLVLIEAVTGSVPFALDTVLGTFMARTDRPLEVPAELGPLAPVFQQAGAADPQERIDAASFAEAVAGVARKLRAPEPLPLPGLSTRGEAVELEGEATELAGRRLASGEEGLSVLAGDLSVAVPSPAPSPPATPHLPPASVTQSWPPVPPPPAARPPYVPPPAAPARPAVPPLAWVPPPASSSAAFPSVALPRARRRRSPRRWVRRFAVLVAALALAAAGVAAGLVLTRPAPTYVVPALKGVGVAKATTLLVSEHLQLVVLGSQWGPMKKGSIVQQSPGAGTRLHAHGSVSVTVSRGPSLSGSPTSPRWTSPRLLPC